jgi:Xaa-Pro aminopeptidase
MYKLIIALLITTNLSSQEILLEKDRAVVVNNILKERLNNLLPELMDQSGIDMWVLISREYNEDPVLKTMLPAEWLNARRRTIILFYRNKKNNTIDKLAVARYNFGDNILSAWDKEKQPVQWERLVELIQERNPEKIGLNFSTDFNISDGLDKTDYDEFMDYLPLDYQNKIVSAQKLSNLWIETRTDYEMKLYENIIDITHDIILEAFSNLVIKPGLTTTTDVEWWMRQKVTDLGLDTWFHPTVDIQRNSELQQDHLHSFSDRPNDKTIIYGDLLHCDFGVTYLRLNSDCQQIAYVMKESDIEIPEFLNKALQLGNNLQDILTNNFKYNHTGNEILIKSLEEAKQKGLRPSIYTHPLGSYGHSSGPTIGMWDSQGGVPGAGDYPLNYNTVYAIELNITSFISEWNRDIKIMLEEAGFFGNKGFRYVNNRQTKIIEIPFIN